VPEHILRPAHLFAKQKMDCAAADPDFGQRQGLRRVTAPEVLLANQDLSVEVDRERNVANEWGRMIVSCGDNEA